MKRTTAAFMAMLLATLSPGWASDEKWWDHELSFDSLPSEQEPHWISSGRGGAATLEEGRLVLSTTDEKQSVAFTLSEPGVHETLTVEFRVKARETFGGFAGHFNITVGDKVYVFKITNAEERTCRAVLENGTMIFYKEGEQPITVQAARELRDKNNSRFLIGDASTQAIGVTEWSEFRWSWGKAVHEK